MVKKTSASTTPTKKIIKILLFTPLILIGLIILYVVWIYATAPIFDKLDHDKFIKLDTQMQKVFQDIKTASNGTDDWKYLAVCSANHTGDWPTGDYNCVTSISTQKTVTSVQEINDLQTKYYPVIDGSDMLVQKTELDPESPNDFGKNFVVSSAEKNYVEKKSKIECNYLIKLYQSVENSDLTSDAYGFSINNGTGKALVSLRCSETANEPWYPLSETADLIVP